MSDAKVALVDMDGTLVDYEGQLFNDLERLRSSKEPSIAVHELWPPHIKARAKLIKSQPGWWEHLPDFKLGWDVYELLCEIGFEIHLLTKGPNTTPNAWTEKKIWCQNNIDEPGNNITITGDKSLVYGRILVDDFPDYMTRWLERRPRGIGIMPAHDYNKGYSHPSVIRYDGSNLDEVKTALELAFLREPGKETKA